MKYVLVLAGLSALFGSCKIHKNQVAVVFKNETGKDFISLNVNIRGQKFTFTDVKNNQKTRVLIVPESYSYCYAQAITKTDTLVCQPDDYVGEKLYKKGKLLMRLFILSDEGNNKYMWIRQRHVVH
jgi:hypothetical protein